MVDPTQHSGLGRGFDFSLQSNRVAVVGFAASLAVLGASALWRDDFGLFSAAAAAVAVFLGWAIGRELDPELPGAATVSMAISLGFALFTVPGAIASAVAMLALRMVSGTVGTRIGWGDTITIGLIGLATGLNPNVLVSAAVVAIWLWAAPEVGKRRLFALAALALGVVGGAAWTLVGSDGYPSVEITGMAYVLAALAGGAMMLAARPAEVTVSNDVGTGLVLTQRVRMARVAAGSMCLWAAVWGGVAGFWEIGPVFAGLIAAAVYRVFVHPA